MKAVAIVGGVIVVIVILYFVFSGSDASYVDDAEVPTTIACATTYTVKGSTANFSDEAEAGLTDDWVKVRSNLAARVRKVAEDAATKSLTDIFAQLACPTECPKLTRVGKPKLSTTTALWGVKDWLTMDYTAEASSQASQDFSCK